MNTHYLHHIFHLLPVGHLIMKITILYILLLSIPRSHSVEPTSQDNTLTSTNKSNDFFANCQLQVQVPESAIYDFVTEETLNVLYAHLEFSNIDLDPKTGYLSNKTHYVTPLRWVLAARQRGKLLLQFPAIFGPLSLWSLTLDVRSISVPVKIESCPGFEQASDEEKQEVVATAFIEGMNYEDSQRNTTEFKVCQEITHLPDGMLGDATWIAILLNVYFVVYNTRYECWSEGTGQDLKLMVYSTPLWLTLPIIMLGVLGAVVLPLVVVQFIQRNNSPYVKEIVDQDDQGNEVPTGKVNKYYHKITNIPIGAKYITFYHTSPIIVALRFIIGFGVVYVMFCPEIFFRLDDYFQLRYNAYQRINLMKIPLYCYNILRAAILLLPLVWFIPSIPSIIRHLYKTQRFSWSDTPNTFRPYHAESSKERSYFGLFPFPDPKQHIPRHPLGTSGFSCLYYYMMYRIQTALRGRLLYAVYVKNLAHMWNGIVKLMWPSDYESVWNIMAVITSILTIPIFMIIVATFNLIILFFSTLVYLLPSAYILVSVTNTHKLIISFTMWAYNTRIWKWLMRQSEDNETDGEEDAAGGHDGIAMVKLEQPDCGSSDDQPCSSKMAGETDPKQTVVRFRKGSTSSANAYVEDVYTPTKKDSQRWLPLPYLYANIYKSIVPVGESGGRRFCLNIAYVLVSVVLAILITSIVLSVGLMVVCMMSVMIVLLSTVFVLYFLRILALCTLLSTFMVLCFTGLVVNSERVIPFCLLGLSLIGFIISAVTGLYTTYSKLLRLVIKITQGLRPGLCFLLVERFETHKIEGESGEKTVSKVKKSVKIVPLVSLRTIDKEMETEVMIEEKLFWHVVEKTIPLRMAVMSKVVQVTVVVVAVVVAIIVLVDISELKEVAPFSVTLTILVITLVFTHVKSLISVSQEEEEEDLEGAVKTAIAHFEDPAMKTFVYPENKSMLLDCEY